MSHQHEQQKRDNDRIFEQSPHKFAVVVIKHAEHIVGDQHSEEVPQLH